MPSTYPPQDKIPNQTQIDDPQPGLQHVMEPGPNVSTFETEGGLEEYRGNNLLKGKAALITGGDSGIGESAAILYAREGCNVAIVYRQREEKDAQKVKSLVEKEGVTCLLIPSDVSKEELCKEMVEKTVKEFGRLDILVNNAAVQHLVKDIMDLSTDQLTETFTTNIFSMFWLTKAALPHLKRGSSIINTTSITAYKGSAQFLDYASTKGAIVAFTRSLSQQLAPKGIRVNAVAPGPIWTPLQPVSRSPESMDGLVNSESVAPLGRMGQPAECGSAYVFLASNLSSYYTGQIMHPNGGVPGYC